MPILEARDVHYAYETHRVLRGVSLALERGKLYAILGPSGCGKTTLLSLLGGLDSPTQGQILFDGEDIAQHGLARHRRDHVSFVFQAYNLIDYLTPAENVALSGTPHPHPPGLVISLIGNTLLDGVSWARICFFVNAMRWGLRRESVA